MCNIYFSSAKQSVIFSKTVLIPKQSVCFAEDTIEDMAQEEALVPESESTEEPGGHNTHAHAHACARAHAHAHIWISRWESCN